MQDVYLGRQPILDTRRHTVAYELLFRSAPTGPAVIRDDSLATAQVIVGAFCDLGLQQVLGAYKGYINVGSEILLSDTVELLPKEYVVLELLETVEPAPEVLKRCAGLRRQGYRIALDDVVEPDERLERLVGVVDVVKVDVKAAPESSVRATVEALRRRSAVLLAEKVDTPEQAETCTALGFRLFQGYFFARPEILSGRRADPAKMALLRLLSLVLADASPEEIEQALKPHVELSYNLLRLVNSAASGLPRRIHSLRQGILILGQRQLLRWVQLLLYTAPAAGGTLTNPLIQLAAARGKLMELLAAREEPGRPEVSDQAFMVGLLSLLDTLLGMPMAEIVEELKLAPEIAEALLRRNGMLGRLLQLQEWLESGEAAKVMAACKHFTGFNLGDLMQDQLEALRWAHDLGRDGGEGGG
ncbi:EAL and HDOD domain-containing protein [Pelomicrobium sp.]|jgi:EAL and modified HD-GYP domain-containing signal transduction protein|uniref:EAL and HDOD domain-containing protein n=1 Tax=Pelomicrobium sp. TaxID=2815319 RepID=UPI002FDDAB0E